MHNSTKIILIFSFISLFVSLIINIGKISGASWFFVFVNILIFNLAFGILAILIVNKILRTSWKKYYIILFYLVLSCIFCWLLVGIVFFFTYGSFLSINGVFFFIGTRGFFSKILLYFGFFSLAIALTLFFIRYTNRRMINKKEIKRVKKEVSHKIKKIHFLYWIVLIVLVGSFFVMPGDATHRSSPFVDVVLRALLDSPDSAEINSSKSDYEIFNVSSSVKDPNIVFILLESVSASKMHYSGYERNVTPNIDLLADRGVVFNNAYSTASHSEYAQPAVLSSRYILINEWRNFFNIDYPREFIWDVLKRNNYSTAYISAQNDEWADMKNYYNMDSLDIYRYSLSDGIYDYGKDGMRNDYDEKIIPDVDNFLGGVNDSFFLYVNLQATHYPYEYPEDNSVFLPDEPDSIFTSYINIAEEDYNKTINRYDNSLLYVDKQVGALMNLLEEHGFSNNTIIILSADHGEVFNDMHGTIRHGSGIYEEEVRIPLIISVPGVGHKVIDERVRHLDVVPSVLSISNFTPSPEFQGETMKKDTDIFLMAQNQNFKIGLIRDDIKYIIDRATLGSEAYNLTEDPDELNNLIVDVDDAKFYRENYGSVLWPWYYCQMDYYENERWLQGEIINCA